ncbi:Tnni3 interacting kinase [Colletotrichum higginsianum IMI 349063]|uniref:Tnni3 interacting kinase n=2 Tax=Colletotrichum higginsianum TaxID=80884 RepID=A0A1B7YR50_COLHI|nr:Tnni3 interacting kinase [Colletotrichum higginsianum IMI 349063]OBR14493.1 Tnni3 interacting kinase [Colletotrichum higginsianum IMI 349063]TID01389.1 putative ankyrin repeat protein [Colletotrichum higginsianum]
MANLRDLPPELKIAVAEALAHGNINGYRQADKVVSALAALSATDRFFHKVTDPLLYTFGVMRHPYLLCWATEVGNLDMMKKILQAGSVDPQTGIIRYDPLQEYVPWNPKTESPIERFRRFYRCDGRHFQKPEDYFDALRGGASNPPAPDDGSSPGSNRSDHGAILLFEHSDLDDTSSEEFSENASIADRYSAGEASHDDEDLDGAPAHGNLAADDAEDGHSVNSYDTDEQDEQAEAIAEMIETVKREVAGVIRYYDDFDVEQVDQDDILGLYWFPVHIAATNSDLPALHLLVEHGALLNIPSKGICGECTALYWGDMPSGGLYPAWTPLHLALCRGHTEIAKYILMERPHTKERLVAYDESPWAVLPAFISAIRCEDFQVAEFCLEQGIDDATSIDLVMNNATLLWRAFWETEMFREALEILLRYGAEIDYDLGDGHTLLVEACLHGHFKQAIDLVNAGADTTVVLNSPGPQSALDYAWDRIDRSFPTPIAGCSVLDICCGLSPILSQPGMEAPLPMPPRPRCRPSHKYGSDLIRLLLDTSEGRNAMGCTSLHVAASAHNSKAVKILLDFGMDPSSLDAEGFSALVRTTRCEENYDPELWFCEFPETISVLAEHLRTRRDEGIASCNAANKGTNSSATADGNDALLNIMESRVLAASPRSKLIQHAAALELVATGLADINTRDKHGHTLLMLAVAGGDTEITHSLMKLGASLKRRPAQDDLALLWTTFVLDYEHREPEEVYRLICSVDTEGRIFREPRFLAFAMCELRHKVGELMALSIQPKTLILGDRDASARPGDKQQDPQLVSGLREAETYVDHMASNNERFDGYLRKGWTLLHIAVELGFESVVETLLSQGADANKPTPDGLSPLLVAMKSRAAGSPGMFSLLFNYGADPHANASEATKSPIDFCIREGRFMMFSLLKNYPIRGHPRAHGNLYLHTTVSVQMNGRSCVSEKALLPLIKAGADVNAKDQNGDTPLSFLINEALRLNENLDLDEQKVTDSLPVVPMLIRAGASPSARNNKGKTVMDMMAEVRNHKDGLFGLRDYLRSTLLYDVMLYRNGIGL